MLSGLVEAALGLADSLIAGFEQCCPSGGLSAESASAAACAEAVREPHLLHCILYMLLLTSAKAALPLSGAAKSSAASTAAASTGSTAGSSSTGSMACKDGLTTAQKDAAAALQFACANHQQLPESLRELLGLLGSNGLAAVWAAGLMQVPYGMLCSAFQFDSK
jgi:hypothetical protein